MRVNLKNESGYTLSYKTGMSVGMDVVTTTDLTLPVGEVVIAPTGLWIKDYDLEASMLGEIQVRIRSGLSTKAIILANGVGTVDLDYPDEIGVLLLNLGKEERFIKAGDRIGQLILAEAHYLGGNDITVSGEERTGGYGSTGA